MQGALYPREPSVNPGFGHWLAGFIDGEGYFGIHRIRRDGNYCWALRFTIKLRIDDLAILQECRRRVGAGNIRREGPKVGHPQAHWTIESRNGCWALATILDRYPLRAKKARDYAIWRRALDEWSNGDRGHRWIGQRDWSEFEVLHAELDRVRNTIIGA